MKKKILIALFYFVFSEGVSQTLQQAYDQGKGEAASVFRTWFYETTCGSNDDPESTSGFSLTKCWKPYDQNNGYYTFVSFCYQYQSNMINTACNTSSCQLRNYTLEVLRGFNEELTLNPNYFNTGYVPSSGSSPCTTQCH